MLLVAGAAGRIDEQVERAMGWLLGLGRFEAYRGLIREDRHLLPRAAIRDALAQTMDFPTILGNFSFDPDGEAVYDPIVFIVKDGELQLFE